MVLPTYEQVSNVLSYDPESGIFRWKKDAGRYGRIKAGSIAGSISKIHGYRQIGIGDHSRSTIHAARLAWLLMTGSWPKETIDHINHDKADDRWINLREATVHQNCMNKPLNKTNTSGFKGVSYSPAQRGLKPWRARIGINGKVKCLGRYFTKEEAHAAYCEAAKKYFGDFASFDKAA